MDTLEVYDLDPCMKLDLEKSSFVVACCRHYFWQTHHHFALILFTMRNIISSFSNIHPDKIPHFIHSDLHLVGVHTPPSDPYRTNPRPNFCSKLLRTILNHKYPFILYRTKTEKARMLLCVSTIPPTNRNIMTSLSPPRQSGELHNDHKPLSWQEWDQNNFLPHHVTNVVWLVGEIFSSCLQRLTLLNRDVLLKRFKNQSSMDHSLTYTQRMLNL